MTELVVNGARLAPASDPRTPLLELLREREGLTGTKDGCGEGECGACTVLVDGRARIACLTPAGMVAGRRVTTVEGLRGDPLGERLVDAFRRHGAVQCGFCTPGMLLAAHAGLTGARPPRCPEEIVDALRGNLCRCTGYASITGAVADVAGRLPEAAPATAPEPPAPPPARSAEATASVPTRSVETPASVPARSVETPASADPRFLVPGSLGEALDALARLGDRALVLAGGTNLLVAGPLEDTHPDATPVWIGGLAELGTIELGPVGQCAGRLRIGAAVTWARLAEDPVVAAVAPALAEAAARVGGPQIRSAGTLGGNLMSADPGADGVAALAVHDASAELTGTGGSRLVPVLEVGTASRPGELLTAVHVPVNPVAGRIEFFVKVGPRHGRTMIDKVTLAFRAERAGDRLSDVRMALGAVGPPVLRATEAEHILTDGTVDTERIVAAADAGTLAVRSHSVPGTPDSALALHENSQRDALALRQDMRHSAALSGAAPVDGSRTTAAHRGRVVRGLVIRELCGRLGLPLPGRSPGAVH